jgi:hypothetical protein
MRSGASSPHLGRLAGQLVSTERREVERETESVAHLVADLFGPALCGSFGSVPEHRFGRLETSSDGTDVLHRLLQDAKALAS